MRITIDKDDLSADITFSKNHWLISIVNNKTGKIIETKELNSIDECFIWIKESMQNVETRCNN